MTKKKEVLTTGREIKEKSWPKTGMQKLGTKSAGGTKHHASPR